jgi:IS5 family transposase
MAQDSFIDALLPPGFERNERLERVSGLIDWDRLAVLVRKLRPGETGRPPYEPLAMFKALLLQQWYGLSEDI